jgi:hypothetical protein
VAAALKQCQLNRGLVGFQTRTRCLEEIIPLPFSGIALLFLEGPEHNVAPLRNTVITVCSERRRIVVP